MVLFFCPFFPGLGAASVRENRLPPPTSSSRNNQLEGEKIQLGKKELVSALVKWNKHTLNPLPSRRFRFVCWRFFFFAPTLQPRTSSCKSQLNATERIKEDIVDVVRATSGRFKLHSIIIGWKRFFARSLSFPTFYLACVVFPTIFPPRRKYMWAVVVVECYFIFLARALFFSTQFSLFYTLTWHIVGSVGELTSLSTLYLWHWWGGCRTFRFFNYFFVSNYLMCVLTNFEGYFSALKIKFKEKSCQQFI